MIHALDKKYAIAPHVKMRRVDDETVILDMRRAQYCGLNEVGTRFVEIMDDGEKTPRETFPELLDEFDVEVTQLEEDINALVAQLYDSKVIIERVIS